MILKKEAKIRQGVLKNHKRKHTARAVPLYISSQAEVPTRKISQTLLAGLKFSAELQSSHDMSYNIQAKNSCKRQTL